ncbi:L,D-transpeptidase family protein [Variovorax sp. IB41]|uniref:L,D-transpeptidase family protein n=1 Tax=Variovorax sp. IB41 TaxID=2779370 RepID=UPI0018E6F86D|nr:L,D-transpeptidase family protein [Variovorax sp. IB41]MBJ2157072.1 L,D-transpeptidase family protein [Variovorax sp. IB41]
MAHSQGKRRRLVTDIVRRGRLQNPPFPRRGNLLAVLMTASALMLAAPGAAFASNKPGSAKTSSSVKAGKSADKAAGNRRAAHAAGSRSSAKEARASKSVQAKGKKASLAETRTASAATAAKPSRRSAPAASIQEAGSAEARLISVYEMFGRGQARPALAKARDLVRDYPNFQLAQLVYGDLLAAQVPPTNSLPDNASIARLRGNPAMSELHEESRRRLQALRERPPAGTVPSQFLSLSTRSRYAIAVDASRSRLYLLENSDKGLKLVADYYISVGKSGTDKVTEGDARTPLGVYYITSSLDPKSLKDFYGAGALPINYPNPYDVRRGKTGGGIWLHGTPPQQFARAPLASDGCVVMANPDLKQLLRKVQIGATPVVTARSLQWISPPQAEKEAQTFTSAITAWKDTRASGNEAQLKKFYLPDFQRNSKKSTEGISVLHDEVEYAQGKRVQFKDMSYLHWRDGDDTMVATFGEVFEGEKSGRTRRQYWLRQGTEWKLFHEEILG